MNHYLVWLSRLHRCRGFGVQSPSAYWFIRYVVSEHYPYYAYAEMKAQYPHEGFEAHHIGRLLFRMANFLQTDHCLFLSSFHPAILKDYIHQGCQKTTVESLLDDTIYKYGVLDADCSADNLDLLRRSFANDGAIVLLHIKRSKAARALWHHVTHSDLYGVTLDLYYCGIVFLDTTKYKASYMVNY